MTEPKLQEHHGQATWTDVEMDLLRCAHSPRVKPAPKHQCSIAKELFRLCRKHAVAMIVTRCGS